MDNNSNDFTQAERIERFRQFTRQLGEEIERIGLTEQDVDSIVEQVRQELHEERHEMLNKQDPEL